jgi:hypothetical protein
MKSYRVYWLNHRRRILKGDWIQAQDDHEASRKAAELCNEESAAIEVWDRARPVDEIDCPPEGEGVA